MRASRVLSVRSQYSPIILSEAASQRCAVERKARAKAKASVEGNRVNSMFRCTGSQTLPRQFAERTTNKIVINHMPPPSCFPRLCNKIAKHLNRFIFSKHEPMFICQKYASHGDGVVLKFFAPSFEQ